MPHVNIHEAKSNLSRLIETVEGGADVVIARNGRPVARLVPFEPKRQTIRIGLAKGKYRLPDDFDRDDGIIETMFTGRFDG
jgi:prevent-host-death family protein